MLRVRSKWPVLNEYRCSITFITTVFVVKDVQERWNNLPETGILYRVILLVEHTMARLVHKFGNFYAACAESRLGIVAHVQVVS